MMQRGAVQLTEVNGLPSENTSDINSGLIDYPNTSIGISPDRKDLMSSKTE